MGPNANTGINGSAQTATGQETVRQRLHAACEILTEALICFLVIFTPWAFGTTQTWSMALANRVGYALGVLLVVKWCLRRFIRKNANKDKSPDSRRGQLLVQGMALFTIILLVYVWVSLVNARATYEEGKHTFAYHDAITWLPHTYDTLSTWPAFWNYLAWAAMFWAIRDWLRGGFHHGTVEIASEDRSGVRGHRHVSQRTTLTPRVRRLLWILSANGSLLALQGLLQQTSGTAKLLWFKETYYNREVELQFGPFAYRANGAQYLNLIWPVALGFWWWLQRGFRLGQKPLHHSLLGGILLMIVAPLISLSRGGALVTLGLVGLCGVLLFVGLRGQSLWQRTGVLAVLVVAVLGGLATNWNKLESRMKQMREGWEGRARTYQLASKMAEENPLFGTGAETFQTLYQFYKINPDEYWPGQLHNDWLETRITFGWIGFGLILAALTCAVAHWFVATDGFTASWRLVGFIWVAMTGALIHARWDFPFQVYSIMLVFLIYCGLLSVLKK